MARLAVVGVLCTACAGPPAVVEAGDASSGRVLESGCAGSTYRTIQDAIDASASGDVIEVCAGTWSERLVVAGKVLTLRSRDGAAATVIDAEGRGIALTVSRGSEVVVEGLTFRDGATSGVGAGVSCTDSTIDLRDSVLEEGSAIWGGGFGTGSCTGVVEGCTFRANDASDLGGGLYSSGAMDLVGNTFDGNTAGYQGGGAFVLESVGEIRGNTFSGNTSGNDGGGCVVLDGAPLVEGNTFEDNEAGDEGGGLRVKGAESVISHNVIRGNRAGWRGGGSKISHDEVTMTGNTFDGNTASGAGGALLLFESASLLTDETYTHNHGEDGGAVAILEGWGGVIFEGARFEDNVADKDGGHLYIELGGFETVLRRAHLSGGDAERGGAVAATKESDEEAPTGLRLENTLLRSNVASDAGGALWLEAVTGGVTNSLLVDNEAPDGAGMAVVDGLRGLEVINSVLSANRGGAAVHVDSGAAPTLRYDDFYGNDDDFDGLSSCIGIRGNLDEAPGFVDPAGGDYRLGRGSPLVDAGDPAIVDRDSTISDIGLFGGPAAAP